MRQKIGSFLSETVWIYDILKYVFPVLYLCILFIPFPLPWGTYLILPIIQWLLFLFYKDFGDDIKKDFKICRIGMICWSLLPANFLHKFIEKHSDVNISIALEIMFSLILVIIVAYLMFDRDEEKIAELKNFSFSFGRKNKETEYDVVLCKNETTGEEVIWNGIDRFLHMLIIGPTGCGKTSQILIPLILQDIQNGRGVTVIEPKGDLAEKVYAMGVEYGREVLYFNPVYPDCPYFNPLDGEEDEVIETLTTTLNMLTPDSKTFFRDTANNLVRKSLMVIKRLEEAYTDETTGVSSQPATLIRLSDLIHNTGGRGKEMVNALARIPTITESESKQNKDTRDWFLNEYFSDRSKVYENTSGVRTQVANLIQNKYLRRVLNPEDGKSQINFDNLLETGGCIAISTAQGALRELGSYLGYFMIFTYQSAVFRRKGNENTRIPNFLYSDEFQKYSNPGFADILTQGRSYRIAATLATQSREQITQGAGHDGKAFLEVVNANARNLVVFPGVSDADAKFFSDTFGEDEVVKERTGTSRQKFSLAYGLKGMNYPTESVMQEKKLEASFSKTDLVYKKFSEITYRLIYEGSVQRADNGIVNWIPKEINNKLDRIASEYARLQFEMIAKKTQEEEEQRRKIFSDFQKTKNPNSVASGQGVKAKNNHSPTPNQQATYIQPDDAENVGSFNPEPTIDAIYENTSPEYKESADNIGEFTMLYD